jgi:transcriptional regulator with XRE-family HTH domain
MKTESSEFLETRLHDLGDFIRDQRRNARLSLRKLSELAGISNPYLSQIERGLRKPSAEILQGIARGLRISAETLYVRAGILDERGDPPDLVAAVVRDPSLTELRNFEGELSDLRGQLHLVIDAIDKVLVERRVSGTAG